MPKNLAKQPAKTARRASNGKPENRAKRALNRKKRHKPFGQMTLEELTLFGFQLAYEQHQQRKA
jgi:hypothetical protein